MKKSFIIIDIKKKSEKQNNYILLFFSETIKAVIFNTSALQNNTFFHENVFNNTFNYSPIIWEKSF